MDQRARDNFRRSGSGLSRSAICGGLSSEAILLRFVECKRHELSQEREAQSQARCATSPSPARRDKKKVEAHEEAIESGEIVVLLQDECHLLWGDCCGYVWGKRGAAIAVLMTNQKERQTYYGAVNLVSREFHLKPYSSGNGENTVAYLKWLMKIYAGKKLWLVWDGATYHRDRQCKEFLAEVNHGLEEKDWRVTCIAFAPNAPEQNPVEDIWLAGKNYLRKKFSENKTFAAVKESFCGFLQSFLLDSVKFDWYAPSTQII